MNSYYKILCLFFCSLSGYFSCTTTNVAGGSSSTDNGRVLGMIYTENGVPAANVEVTILTSNNDPYRNTASTMKDTTDTSGRYEFIDLTSGQYTVEALALDSRMRAIMSSIVVDSGNNHIPAVALSKPGSINVRMEYHTTESRGYVYIPGTSFFGIVHEGFVTIDSVPAGLLPALLYANIDNEQKFTITTNITIASGTSRTIADFSAWKYSKELFLNTSITGANVNGTVHDFPVLIRLSAKNFDFGQADTDGGDLRFKKSDHSPLTYEIERWDSEARIAEIWVKIDTVYGSDSTQVFTMYWGNPEALSQSNGSLTFDTTRGFQGVWHLTGSGTATEYDATANSYDGTPHNLNEASSVEGAIGMARSFNGSSGYIDMQNTATGKLDFPRNGYYSMSLWVYADTIDSVYHGIAGKGHEQYYMQFKCLKNNKATWEFVEFEHQRGWEYTEDSTPPSPGAKQWIYLTGVRSGSEQMLYINGDKVAHQPALMPGAYDRTTTDNFTIARFGRPVTIPYQQGWSYFRGRIDEVRVMSFAPDDNWIRLCYMNQKSNDLLVRFGK